MIEFTIRAESAADLATQIAALSASLNGSSAAYLAPLAADDITTQATPAEEPVTEAAKKPKAKVAKVAPEPETPKLLDFNTEVAPHVVAAVNNHGKELVASVLTQFGVSRAGEVPAVQWPELLAALDDAAPAV